MNETIEVQKDEYVFGVDDERLVYTDEQLVYENARNSDEAERIPQSEITDVRTDVDKSVSGFRMIGTAVVLVSLLLFCMVVWEVMNGGMEINLITAGGALSGIFGILGAVQFYRADRGAVRVLAIDTADEQFVFYTQSHDEAVDRIAEMIRNQDPKATPDTPSAAAQ